MSYREIEPGLVTYTCDGCGREETKQFEAVVDPWTERTTYGPDGDPWDLDSYPPGWTYGRDDDGTVYCDECKNVLRVPREWT